MRSSRFISILGVLALLASVKATEAEDDISADDGTLSTLTITRTVYGKPTSIYTSISKSSKSIDKISSSTSSSSSSSSTSASRSSSSHGRDQTHEYHTTIHHTYDAPRTPEAPSTHYITETYQPTYSPRSSAHVTISTIQPSAPASSSGPNNDEEVIIKTKTKKHKSKSNSGITATAVLLPMSSSTPALDTASASSSSESTPTSAVVVATTSGSRSLVAKNPANKATISSKHTSPSSTAVPFSSNAPAGAVPVPMETSLVPSPSAGGNASLVSSPSVASSTALTAAPSSSLAPLSAKPSSADVNNVNKKVGPSSTPSSNGGQSDKTVASSLVLAWIMAAVAAF